MKTRTKWILGASLGLAVVGIIVAAVVFWPTLPPDYPEDAIWVPKDVSTLRDALKQAWPGATIVLDANADSIAGPLSIDIADLTLTSHNGRAQVRGVGGEPALSILADGVTLRGVDVSSESIGVVVEAARCWIDDVLVHSAPIGIQLNTASHCELTDVEMKEGRTGLELVDSRGARIQHVTATGMTEYGIRILGSSYNRIEDITFVDTAVGISVEGGSSNNSLVAGRLEGASIAGIEIRGSSENSVEDVRLLDPRIGILVDGAAGTEIVACDIVRPVVAGIHLQQAVQNRLIEVSVEEGRGSGLQLSQSTENALLYNRIRNCRGTAIQLTNSHKNLLAGNVVKDCLVGFHLSRSEEGRILRNIIQDSEQVGLWVSGGAAHRVLDNELSGGEIGLLLSDARATTLLRNEVSGSVVAGLALVNTTGENHIADNTLRSCGWGLAALAVPAERLRYNHTSDNETGIAVYQLDEGLRIEGNVVQGNEVGVHSQDSIEKIQGVLASLGLEIESDRSGAQPILANNVFYENSTFDIENSIQRPLKAAGNWWGDGGVRDSSTARVSDGVDLDESAWTGTLAVGTDLNDLGIVLGRILQSALAAGGYRVIDLIGMGDQERVQDALRAMDVDLIWWGGDIDTIVGASDAEEALIITTEAREGWSAVVSSRIADQLDDWTATRLAEWARVNGESLRCAATSDFSDDAFNAFVETYGLQDSIRSLTRSEALEEVEALLKFGAVDIVFVRNLEETLTIAGFTAIIDVDAVLPEAAIAMVVHSTLVETQAEIPQLLAALAGRITDEVVHDMLSRIRLLHADPKDVAREFLQK